MPDYSSLSSDAFVDEDPSQLLEWNPEVSYVRLLGKIDPFGEGGVENIPHFQYISSMLNLNDTNICALLPYLLTAYICNAPSNQLLMRGDTARMGIFHSEDEYAGTGIQPNPSKCKKSIELLSKTFSLENHKVRYPRQGETCYLKDRENPYHNAFFSDAVFMAWCVVVLRNDVCSFEDGEIIKKVVSQIDLKSSHLLYLYHTNSFRTVTSAFSDTTDIDDIEKFIEFFENDNGDAYQTPWLESFRNRIDRMRL